MNMLGNIPHQKKYFYHLPTRGRAGIKLGDVDTSPTYLYFSLLHAIIVSILDVLYTFSSNNISFFGTNLLT